VHEHERQGEEPTDDGRPLEVAQHGKQSLARARGASSVVAEAAQPAPSRGIPACPSLVLFASPLCVSYVMRSRQDAWVGFLRQGEQPRLELRQIFRPLP
jgi:hypothetical protein